MSHAGKIARNSAWMIGAPLALNVASLAVTALIARSLGKVDYGRFVFSTSFSLMFLALGDLGLRTLTIRALAERPAAPELVLGKFLTSRTLFVLLGYAVLVLAVNLIGYPPETRLATYLMGLTIIPRGLTTIAHDTFEAHEKMQYVAYTDLAAGFFLTALSVVVVLAGLGLAPLILTYVAGRVLGLALAAYYLVRHFIRPRPSFDLGFTRRALAQGAPFFYPAFLASIGQRVGIVLLSKLSGDARVGLYGAASELVDRLIIIPEGMAGAFFPTIIRVYGESPTEAEQLFRRFFGLSALIALPLAIGGTLTAPQIIEVLYGSAYGDSVVIFQLLMWALLLRFFNSLSIWTLGAIHQEKLGAITIFVTTPIYMALSALGITVGGPAALAAATVCQELMVFVLLSLFMRRVFTARLFEAGFFLRVVAASVLMAPAVWAAGHFAPLGKWNLTISIPVGMVVFTAAVLGLRAVTVDDLRELVRTIRKKT